MREINADLLRGIVDGDEEVLRTTYSNCTWQNHTFDAAKAATPNCLVRCAMPCSAAITSRFRLAWHDRYRSERKRPIREKSGNPDRPAHIVPFHAPRRP
jgi:hypothetical protein